MLCAARGTGGAPWVRVTTVDDKKRYTTAPSVSHETDAAERAQDHIAGDEGRFAEPGTTTFDVKSHLALIDADSIEVDASVAPEAGALGELPVHLKTALAVELSRTMRLGRGSIALDARVQLDAGLDARTPKGLTDLLGDSAEIFGAAETAYGSLAASVEGIESTATELEAVLERIEADPNDFAAYAEAAALGQELEAQLRDAQSTLGDAGDLLDRISTLADDIGEGRYEIRAGALARGFTEVGAGVVSRTFHAGDKHRFDALVAAHVVVPLPAGDATKERLAELDEVVALESSMIAMRAYVDVTVKGLDRLKSSAEDAKTALADLDRTVGEAADTMAEINADPLGATSDPELTDRAESLATDLETQGAALASTLEDMTADLEVQTEAGVEVVQATAPFGVGIDELAVRWQFDPTESFSVAVKGYLTHAVGHLGSEATELELDDRGRLVAGDTRAVNGYSDFFARTVGVDASATKNDTSVRGGFATDGRALTVHLGFTQQIGRATLHAGVIDPDLLRGSGHRVLPTAGVELRVSDRVDLRASGTLDAGAGGVGGGLNAGIVVRPKRR